jgi:hypothetical protein
MKSIEREPRNRAGHWVRHNAGAACAAAFFLAIVLCSGRPATAQVAVSGWEGGFSVSAGGTASGYYLGYGQREMIGPAVFVDADTRLHLGVEGEARWIMFPQTANVHDTTWLIGPRYSIFPLHRKFYPYVKGLVGVGQFNFPYNLATGSYLVIAPGGGVDYRLSRRVRFRVIDAEYQFWPQFTYGSLPSWGISTGVRVRVF